MKDNLDEALYIDYPTALHREAERLVQRLAHRGSQGGGAGLRREAQAGVHRALIFRSAGAPAR